MSTPQPRNLFTTNTFISLAIGLITASTPNISDIIKNGGTVDKYLNLLVVVLAGLGVSAEKMKNEPNLYTPNWEPLGKSKSQVLENPEVQTISLPLGKDESVNVVVDTTLNTVQDVIDDAQEVVDVVKNPLNLLKLIK